MSWLCRIRPWELPLADLVTEADFPGVEVQDTWALGMVGKLPGSGSGRSLMFGGHVEVVPPGDFAAWTTHDPFAATITTR